MSDIKIKTDVDSRAADSALRNLNNRFKDLEDQTKRNNQGFRAIGGILRASIVGVAFTGLIRGLGAAYEEAKKLGDSATLAQKAFVSLGDSAGSFKTEYLRVAADWSGKIAINLGLVNKEELEFQEQVKRNNQKLEERNKLLKERDELSKTFGKDVNEQLSQVRLETGNFDKDLSEYKRLIDATKKALKDLENDEKRLGKKFPNYRNALMSTLEEQEKSKNEFLRSTFLSGNVKEFNMRNEAEMNKEFENVPSDELDKMLKETRDRKSKLLQEDTKAKQERMDAWQRAKEEEIRNKISEERKGELEILNARAKMANEEKDRLEKVRSKLENEENTRTKFNQKKQFEKSVRKLNAEISSIERDYQTLLKRNEAIFVTELDFAKAEKLRDDAVVNVLRPETVAAGQEELKLMEEISRRNKKKEEDEKKADEDAKARQIDINNVQEMRHNDNIQALIDEELYLQAIEKLENDISDLDKDAIDYASQKYNIEKKIAEVKERQAQIEEEARKKREKENLDALQSDLAKQGITIENGKFVRTSKSGRKTIVSAEDVERTQRSRKKAEEDAARTGQPKKKETTNDGKTPEQKQVELLTEIATALAVQKNK